jgi:RNA polymerase sigma-70 factor (ECF subfamily)
MSGEETATNGSRRTIYCIVPADLADELHEPLREHFADDPHIEVVVDRRQGDRRSRSKRREDAIAEAAAERRRVRNVEGRRVGERRAQTASIEIPKLPRKLREHADSLVFIERIEPADEHAEDLDTARLVVRFQAGDQAAFTDLYVRYFDRAYGYMRVVLKDPHEAEDATQQVFLSALEALPRYELRGKAPVRAWLFTIFRNHAVSRLRGAAREDVVEPAEIDRQRDLEEPNSAPGGEALTSLDWVTDKDLVFLVERLPLAQRQVLLLRYQLALSGREIAEILDRTPEDVRKLQERATRFLRDRLVALGRAPRRSGSGTHDMLRHVSEGVVLRARRLILHR